MKISTITTQKQITPSFNGEWKERRVGHFFANRYHTECKYIPDAGESMHDIAMAWARKTKKLPSEWIRSNNIYNQTGEVHYQLGDSYYMPLELIKASLEIERKKDKYYGQEEISIIELARLAQQTGDTEAVKEYDEKLIELARKKVIASDCVTTNELLNNYKEGLGHKAYNHRYN